MQNVTIDRKKDEEIDDWAADKEPGDRVCLWGTIKSLDDQSMVVTVDEVNDAKEDDAETADDEAPDAAPTQSPPGSLAALDAESDK
jgi:hypothetical protein